MNKTHLPNSNYPQLPPEMQTTTSSSTNTTTTVIGNDYDAQRQVPPPPTYDQATGTFTTATGHIAGHVAGPASGPAQMSMPYQPQQQQQYISTSTCVYTQPQQALPPHQAQQMPITQQPVVIIQQQMFPLGPEPVYITCPNCHVQKLTRIEYEPSTRTHLMAALLCIFGLWCCVCLPYCAGSCMNANHYCGNCNKFLGTYGNGL